MYRAVSAALLLLCVLVSGFLLHDRTRGERDPGSMQQRPEVPAPVAVPTMVSGEGMPFGGVLALGLGLQYRAGDVLLGLELHLRQGMPADYRSVAALLSVGCYLDQGE